MGAENLWDAVSDHDVLLFHPYESFDPVVRLVEQAADDPDVLAIKQTLYRTSGDSPIVRALGRAAQNGKEVTVLVELRARFDEARNVQWARRLEDAGCHVIYGIAGYKTHGKALLIVRRQQQRFQRYVHLATGNYNDKTARLYSDLGLMTADRDIATDVAAFFNLLTGRSEAVGWLKLCIAPTGLRQRFIDLIDREVQVSTPDRPGLIMAKVNSLQDTEICRALYRASRAGVKVRLNVPRRLLPAARGGGRLREHRGPLDHRPLPRTRPHLLLPQRRPRGGLSRQRRLDDAQPGEAAGNPLSHQRGEPAAAADRRFAHLLCRQCEEPPAAVRRRLRGIQQDGPRVRAQQVFYQDAVDAVHLAQQAALQFRPLTRPQ